VGLFVLVPAAGRGERLAAGRPKQYLPLAGRPMLWHVLRALCVPAVDQVFVVLAPNDEEYARNDWSEFGARVQPLYCGGATRSESVRNGLVAASSAVLPDDWVLVHDAARPCLCTADLERLIAACAADRVGGLLAVPVCDTVKRAAEDESGLLRALGTEERASLWLAQTPQMFRAGLLVHALARAGHGATDEASAVEALGLRPRLVAGARANLKVTFPEDVALAEAILAAR